MRVGVWCCLQDMNSGVVFREFKAEVGILSKLRHNNIVMWLGACTKPPNMAVVLEALYSQTSIGPRGRSLSYLLHKTNVQISRLQVLLVRIGGGFNTRVWNIGREYVCLRFELSRNICSGHVLTTRLEWESLS